MHWLIEHGTRVAAIVVLAVAIVWALRRSIPRGVRLALARERVEAEIDAAIAAAEREQRAETLASVLVITAEVLILLVAAFLALGELGFQLGPLIAGAGIAGVAIGFGAQSLVRDVLVGLLILFENQYGKGDVVRIAGTGGVVEDLNLRRTVLRDLDGIVHTIPNGEITVASNFTRSWSRVNVDVSIGYGEDIERATRVIDAVGEDLAADPEWRPRIAEAPKVLRVNAFEESGIQLKVLGTVVPMEQWNVAGELRKRLKAAFDREGIEIPFPHRVVVVRGDESSSHARARA